MITFSLSLCVSVWVYDVVQVGVQHEVAPEVGASSLEDKVNAVLPLQNKDGEPSNGDGTEQDNEQQQVPETTSHPGPSS